MAQIKKNKKLEKNEIDLISNILYTYIKELKDDSIKKISDTIMNNFIIYKQKMINRKLKNLYNIYQSKEKSNLNQKFVQWNQILSKKKENEDNNKNLNNNNNNNNYFNLNLNVGPIINNNNNNHNTNNSNNIKSEENINEKNLFKKKHIKNNNNNINIINSLYNSNSFPNNKNNSVLNKKNNKRPLSSDGYKNFEEKVLLQKMRRNKQSSEKIDKFIKRQEIFSKNNFHKKEKIIKDNEDENKLIYTFEPKINDSLRKLYKSDTVSVEKRLYNDSIIRRNKKLEKQYNNMSKNNNKKPFNQKKIIELYEEYNLRKEKNEQLIKKIEKECGYTYVPSVLHKKNKSFITKNKDKNNKSKNKKDNKNNINNNTNKNGDKKTVKKNNSFTNPSLVKKINEDK
jgi:hypothetical protein